MVNWLDLHWVTSADPGTYDAQCAQKRLGPRISGPAVQHWPAGLYLLQARIEELAGKDFERRLDV